MSDWCRGSRKFEDSENTELYILHDGCTGQTVTKIWQSLAWRLLISACLSEFWACHSYPVVVFSQALYNHILLFFYIFLLICNPKVTLRYLIKINSKSSHSVPLNVGPTITSCHSNLVMCCEINCNTEHSSCMPVCAFRVTWDFCIITSSKGRRPVLWKILCQF